MNDASILILALAVQQLLFAAGWWTGARHLSSDRAALTHWAGFCMVSGLSMLLFTDAAREAMPSAAQVLRNAGLVLAFVLLRRGLLHFTAQPLGDRTLWLAFGGYLVLMAVLGTSREFGIERTVVLSAAISALTLRTAWDVQRDGRAEFGPVAAATIAAPLALVGAAMAVRCVMAIARPQSGAVTITQAAHFNVGLLLIMVVLLAVFHFALGFLVMRRMVTELEHLSSHDSLTRLLNRRAFERRLADEIAAGARSGASMGMLLIDIDHFKRINDHFGHAAGDVALRKVAECLANAARRNDVVARVGGEEFGVLLPATNAAGIRHAAERLRQAVAAQRIELGGQPQLVTISVGASMRLSAETDAEAMLRRADQALYRAKAEGRDRVVFDTLAQVSEGDGPPLASRPVELH